MNKHRARKQNLTLSEIKVFCRTRHQIRVTTTEHNELKLTYLELSHPQSEPSACYIDMGHTGESRQEAYQEALATAQSMRKSYRELEETFQQPAFKVTGKMDHNNWQKLVFKGKQ